MARGRNALRASCFGRIESAVGRALLTPPPRITTDRAANPRRTPMSVAQPFLRTNSGQTLRVVEDPAHGVYWCNMHANLARMPGRACFSTQLVDDIVAYQRDLAMRLRANRDEQPLPHVVLASDGDAFNLGGDLELFCRLIRLGDRERLL